MKTWEDYKTYAKVIDPQAKIELEKAEGLAETVSVLIQKGNDHDQNAYGIRRYD